MARLGDTKAFAAILMAGMAVMVAGFLADVLVHSEAGRTPSASVSEEAGARSAASTAANSSVLPLLAGADVSLGQSTAAQDCGACHSFDKDAPASVGPNLYGIVGAGIAGKGGYDYSDALKKTGGNWTYEQLNHWLFDPEAFAPGTLMSFAGIPDVRSRANVVAFLRTLSDKPAPLPAAANP